MNKLCVALMLLGLSVPVAYARQNISQQAVLGTPETQELARQIFPDSQPDDLLISAAPDQTVRIGVRSHNSTIQVTADGANVTGTLSVNGIPLRLADKAPNGPCTALDFVLSPDGVTTCQDHRYVTAR